MLAIFEFLLFCYEVTNIFVNYKIFPIKIWVFTKIFYFYKLWFTIFAILSIKIAPFQELLIK